VWIQIPSTPVRPLPLPCWLPYRAKCLSEGPDLYWCVITQILPDQACRLVQRGQVCIDVWFHNYCLIELQHIRLSLRVWSRTQGYCIRLIRSKKKLGFRRKKRTGSYSAIMHLVSVLFLVCVHICECECLLQNNVHVSEVHCGSAVRFGQALPGYLSTAHRLYTSLR